MFRNLIIFSLLFFSCRPTIALEAKDASDFGNDFIASMQSGNSVNFIPYRFHLDTFLYNAFGEEYLKLTPEEERQAKESLGNALAILHSAPILIYGYKQINLVSSSLEKVEEDYIYEYVTQTSGKGSTKQAVWLKEIDGEIWIVDIKTDYWLTEFTGQMYEEVRNDLSIPLLLELMEYKYEKQFTG